MIDEKKPVEQEEEGSPSPAFDAIVEENRKLKERNAALLHEQKELLNRLAASVSGKPAEEEAKSKFIIRGGKIIER